MTEISKSSEQSLNNILNKLGVKTVRVMKGPYKLIKVKKSFDAKYKINNLLQVTSLFNLSK